MIKLTDMTHSHDGKADAILTLPFELRQKSRFSTLTDDGQDVGVFLPRGKILRSGIFLTNNDGYCVMVKAAEEAVSVLKADDALQFARACYHLGNRHVPLQILESELRYLTDHVLDQMLEGMHLNVSHGKFPFEPESGAYHKHEH